MGLRPGAWGDCALGDRMRIWEAMVVEMSFGVGR